MKYVFYLELYFIISDLNVSDAYEDADFKIFHVAVPHIGWLILLAVYFVLGCIAVALVAHLFGFHIYLSKIIAKSFSLQKTVFSDLFLDLFLQLVAFDSGKNGIQFKN